MDLITSLSGALGIDSEQAQAVAGAVMANVQGGVEENTEGAAVEEQLASAVPEMGGWMAQAQALAGGSEGDGESGGMLGGLMGAANSGLGNQLLGAVGGKQAQNAALLAGVLGKIGLDESKAAMAAPLVLKFLESRLDPGILDKVMAAAPLLTGQAPEGGAGGVMGALGGMFGS